MRESYRMELYAQRAIRKRRTVIQPEALSRLAKYLDQGGMINQALASIPAAERGKYLLSHSELIVSSDGVEAINVVWAPNSQVCTHRILCAEMREEFQGKHYLGSWVRQLAPTARGQLKAELTRRLECRVQQRAEEQRQGVIKLEYPVDAEPVPDFLKGNLEPDVPEFLSF